MNRAPIGALLLLSCTTVQTPGSFSNPTRPPEVVGPTVALQALRCDSPGVLEGTTAQTTEWLDQNVDARLGSRRISVSPADSKVACGELARDRALYQDAVFGTDWKLSQELVAVVKRVAEQSHADHVWVPLVRPKSGCGTPSGDSYSQPTAPLATAEEPGACAATETDLGLFLFDSDGTLVWKSSAVAGQSELATREAATRMLLANVPARKPSEGVLVKETPP